MKRSRENKDDSARGGTKKPKSIQACTSCRKHKTRCEILDPSRSPVRCHRCQVLTLQCSRTTLGFDWSAPMLAIQQLSKLPFAPYSADRAGPSTTPGELSLPRILSDEQKRHLLDLFDERYTPWLNFKPSQSTSSSLLDIVCCAIASRHLDNALVKLQLQKLTEDSIAKMIFNPRPSESVEAIQALLILSLWTPLGGPPENEGRDGRLLIASARGRLSNEDTEALEEIVENADYGLHSRTPNLCELCTGTGRVPLSRRSPEDLALVEYPKEFDQQVNYGDLRLGLTASNFDLVEEGVSNRLLPGKDVDGWYDGIMIVLEKMKRVKRLMMPLPFLFPHLNVYQDMARLLVLYHALYDARVSVGHIPFGESWHPYFKPHGTEAVGEWGRDMVLATESFLLSRYVFTMVALASGHLVGVKFLMFRGGSHLLGGSDLLLARIVALLASVSCAPGHAPQRTAFLIKGMIAKWEGRFKKPAPVASYPTPTSDHDRPADNSAGMSRTPSNADLMDPSAFAAVQPGTLPPFDIDLNMFMDATPFDADFWNNLAQQTQLLP
ncbi:hypothetical protein B0H14DRAFT_2930159, partial [Mycena olivaceomarginata]